MEKVYLYLDDKRDCKPVKVTNCCITCRDYYSAIATVKALKSHIELTVDLDHDLGTKKTGYDFCKWLVEQGYLGFFHIHSANPVGRFNMRQLLTRYGWVEI